MQPILYPRSGRAGISYHLWRFGLSQALKTVIWLVFERAVIAPGVFLGTPVEKAVGHGTSRKVVERARQLRRSGHHLRRIVSHGWKFRSRTIVCEFSGCPGY